jgi:hypothetical protein
MNGIKRTCEYLSSCNERVTNAPRGFQKGTNVKIKKSKNHRSCTVKRLAMKSGLESAFMTIRALRQRGVDGINDTLFIRRLLAGVAKKKMGPDCS